MKSYRKILTAACCLAILSAGYLLLSDDIWIELSKVHGLHKPSASGTSLEVMAQEAVTKCQSVEYRPVCYEEEVPKVMGTVSMEQAFDVTRAVQDLDQTYAYCHVLGHKLSAKETAKDPSKWKDVISRCPSGLCSNGCIHGAFQERFRAESLNDEEIEKYLPELSDVCEGRKGWSPTGLEQATCYHALGHLLMYITNADIQKSVNLCERVGDMNKGERDFSQLCYDGAFMQIFQPLETEDFALVAGKIPKKEEMAKFCSPFVGTKRQPCWSESWPLVREQILQPSGLEKFCASSVLSTSADKDRCFTGMYYVVGAQLQLDDSKMRQFCSGTSRERQAQCYSQFASRLVETDYRNIARAVDMCKSAKVLSAQDACFSEMLNLSSYDFKPGSQEQTDLCELLPEKWQTMCGRQVLINAP